MEEKDNISILYGKMQDKGLVKSGSEDDFRAYLQEGDNWQNVYDRISSPDVNLVKSGSVDDFHAWLGLFGSQQQAKPSKRKTYEEWYKTVPADRNDTTSYNLKRAYELAPMEELEAWRTSSVEDLESGKNHLNSAYENPETGEYEFVRRKDHPTIQMELDWYNSDDPDAVEFRKKYSLDKSGDYYKYVPRPQASSPYIGMTPMAVADIPEQYRDAYSKMSPAEQRVFSKALAKQQQMATPEGRSKAAQDMRDAAGTLNKRDPNRKKLMEQADALDHSEDALRTPDEMRAVTKTEEDNEKKEKTTTSADGMLVQDNPEYYATKKEAQRIKDEQYRAIEGRAVAMGKRTDNYTKGSDIYRDATDIFDQTDEGKVYNAKLENSIQLDRDDFNMTMLNSDNDEMREVAQMYSQFGDIEQEGRQLEALNESLKQRAETLDTTNEDAVNAYNKDVKAAQKRYDAYLKQIEEYDKLRKSGALDKYNEAFQEYITENDESATKGVIQEKNDAMTAMFGDWIDRKSIPLQKKIGKDFTDELMNRINDRRSDVEVPNYLLNNPMHSPLGISGKKTELGALTTASQYAKKAYDLISNEDGSFYSKNLSLVKGFVDDAASMDFLTFGLTEAARGFIDIGIMKKVEAGKDQLSEDERRAYDSAVEKRYKNLTPEEEAATEKAAQLGRENLNEDEKLAYDAMQNYWQVQQLFKPSGWYTAGQVTADALPFIVAMWGSGGIVNAIKGGAKSAEKVALRQAAKQAEKQATKLTIKQAAKNVYNAGKNVLKAGGNMFLEGGVYASTTGLPHTVAGTLEYLMPQSNATYDLEEGGIKVNRLEESDESVLSAAAKSWGTQMIEGMSEAFSTYGLEPMEAAAYARLFGRTAEELAKGGNRAYKDIVRAAFKKGSMGNGIFRNISSFPNEYIEELFGGFARCVVGLSEWDDEFSGETLAQTAYGLLPMQVVFSAMGGGNLRKHRQRMRQAETFLNEFSPDSKALYERLSGMSTYEGQDLLDREILSIQQEVDALKQADKFTPEMQQKMAARMNMALVMKEQLYMDEAAATIKEEQQRNAYEAATSNLNEQNGNLVYAEYKDEDGNTKQGYVISQDGENTVISDGKKRFKVKSSDVTITDEYTMEDIEETIIGGEVENEDETIVNDIANPIAGQDYYDHRDDTPLVLEGGGMLHVDEVDEDGSVTFTLNGRQATVSRRQFRDIVQQSRNNMEYAEADTQAFNEIGKGIQSVAVRSEDPMLNAQLGRRGRDARAYLAEAVGEERVRQMEQMDGKDLARAYAEADAVTKKLMENWMELGGYDMNRTYEEAVNERVNEAANQQYKRFEEFALRQDEQTANRFNERGDVTTATLDGGERVIVGNNDGNEAVVMDMNGNMQMVSPTRLTDMHNSFAMSLARQTTQGVAQQMQALQTAYNGTAFQADTEHTIAVSDDGVEDKAVIVGFGNNGSVAYATEYSPNKEGGYNIANRSVKEVSAEEFRDMVEGAQRKASMQQARKAEESKAVADQGIVKDGQDVTVMSGNKPAVGKYVFNAGHHFVVDAEGKVIGDFKSMDELKESMQQAKVAMASVQDQQRKADVAEQNELEKEYQDRFDEAQTEEEKAQVIQEYLDQIKTDDFVVLTNKNIEKALNDNGATVGEIQDVRRAYNATRISGHRLGGFNIRGNIFIFADDIISIDHARSTYVHERQHTITRNNPSLVQEIDSNATREELAQYVLTLCGSDAYATKSKATLADEFISMAMELMYMDENAAEIMRNAGIKEELINTITQLDNEQRTSDSLAAARRGRTRNLHVDNDGQGNGRPDRSNQGRRPGEVGGEGSRFVRGGSQEAGQTTEDNEVRPSITADDRDNAIRSLNYNGIASTEDETRFSVRYVPSADEAEKAAAEIAAATGVDIEEARRWVASETSLAAIILDEYNSEYLDYIADDRYSAIKKDSDYPQGTVDFNNICRKRIVFTSMYQRLQKQFPNHVITGEDLATIRNIMKSHGLEVACGLCYVEDRRQLLGEIARFFIEELNDDFKGYTHGRTLSEPAKKKENKDKVKKAEKYRELLGDDVKEDLSIYDLITLDGSTKLYKEHPGIYAAFQEFNANRGQQSGNLFQGYSEYKREILDWSDKKVKSVNDNGGLRIFSYSDFEAHHLIDLVQIIQDCARRGVKIQGYTKVPAFARAIANTGVKLNRSLIPLGDTGIVDGKLAFDPVEGIDINDPNFLESNDNIGNILIGINDEQIRLAMADPFIHFIIPYHSNQSNVLRRMKQTGAWTNYKNEQTEKGENVGKHGVNIYTDVLNAAEAEGNPIQNERQFVERFLAVCKEKGWTPRFARFLNQDENGEYVYTPGYYKFLVDFKLFDEQGNILQQQPVQAVFDDAFNAQILNDYVESKRGADMTPQLDVVYDEIVNALNIGERESDVSYSITAQQDADYMDAVNSGDMETAQRMVMEAAKAAMPNTKVVDENGNPKVVYHGTNNKFTIFDKNRVGENAGGNGAFYFTEMSGKMLYSGAGDYGDIVGAFYLNVAHPMTTEHLTVSKEDYMTLMKEQARKHGHFGMLYDLSEAWDNEVKTDADISHLIYDRFRPYGITLRENIEVFQKLGFDGAIYPYDNVMHYEAFDPSQIKSAAPVTYDDQGNVIPLSERFNEGNDDIRYSVTAEQDAAYRKAYDEGDTEAAMQMVMDAAAQAMPNTKVVDENGNPLVVYHRTPNEFNEFDRERIGSNTDVGAFGSGFYFSPNDNYGLYGRNKMALFINATNPLMLNDGNAYEEKRKYMPDDVTFGAEESKKMSEGVQEEGYDAVIYDDGYGTIEIVAFNPSQIKSAEPFTFDDNGELIPLSERFKPNNNDIRYSFIGRSGAQRLDLKERAMTRMNSLHDARSLEEMLGNSDEAARKIKLATGWERGKDGKWRYEIMDGKMREEGIDKDATGLTLADVWEQPELFTAYPKMKDMEVKVVEKPLGAYASTIINTYKETTEGKKALKVARQFLIDYPTVDDYKKYLKDKISKYKAELKKTDDEGRTAQLEDIIEKYEQDLANSSETYNRYQSVINKANDITETRIELNSSYLTGQDGKIHGDTKMSDGSEEYTLNSILSHEIQHYIQELEGFARGGNPENAAQIVKEMGDKEKIWGYKLSLDEAAAEHPEHADDPEALFNDILEGMTEEEAVKKGWIPEENLRNVGFKVYQGKYNGDSYEKAYKQWYDKLSEAGRTNYFEGSPFDLYKRLAGEVEARNTQARLGMTYRERLETLAKETEDVAREDQLIMMAGDPILYSVTANEDTDMGRPTMKEITTEYLWTLAQQHNKDFHAYSDAMTAYSSLVAETMQEMRRLEQRHKAEQGYDRTEYAKQMIALRDKRDEAIAFAKEELDDAIFDEDSKRAEGALNAVDNVFDKYEAAVEKARERYEQRVAEAQAEYDNAVEQLEKQAQEGIKGAAKVREEYDKATIDKVMRLAQMLMRNGNLDNFTRGEVSRLMSAMRRSVEGNVYENAKKILDEIVKHQLKDADRLFDKQLHTKVASTNSGGAETISGIDKDGRHIIETLREAIGLPQEAFNERMAKANNDLGDESEVKSNNAALELDGLLLAEKYREDIAASEEEERELDRQLKEQLSTIYDFKKGDDGKIHKTLKPEYKGRNLDEEHKATKRSVLQYEKEAEDKRREIRMDRIDAYARLSKRLGEIISASRDRAKEFRSAEIERTRAIHHMVNSEFKGKDSSIHQKRVKDDGKFKPLEWMSSSQQTFIQFMRYFGEKNAEGKGYLFNEFVPRATEASHKEWVEWLKDKEMLDAKAAELFGKGMTWEKLYRQVNGGKTIDLKFLDSMKDENGNTIWGLKDHKLSQGNALYVYMVNKMADGAMKLRAMGITEQDVQQLASQLDQRLLDLADWIQEEYLPQLRERYNEVHERMFGTSMAAIEDYFPLKINTMALDKSEDPAQYLKDENVVSTVASATKKRTVNSQPLDLLNADAFNELSEHIQQMEHWAAFAEFNRDLATLLSYKRFRNILKNMNSVRFGRNGDVWENFKTAAAIVSGNYIQGGTKWEKAITKFNDNVATAKISFRVNTAIKQLLSYPAYFSEASIKNLAKYSNPWGAAVSWNWAIENLPGFAKRWQSRQAGDTRLREVDKKHGKWSDFFDQLAKWGMTPNAAVDAFTVIMGARAVYETKLEQYKKDGYDEEKAKEKALIDASIAYNETQQSSEGAYTSAIQLDKSFLSSTLSRFRNASMGYTRKWATAINNLKLKSHKGYRDASIEFMTKQLVRDGLTEDQAKEAAERIYSRSKWKDIFNVGLFGWFLPLIWKMGGRMWYYLFGDDDDEKLAMLTEDAVSSIFAPIEGLTGGNTANEVISNVLNGNGFGVTKYNLINSPMLSDFQKVMDHLDNDTWRGVNDIINIAIQMKLGVNPQTLTDAIVAVVDAFKGDLGAAKEFMFAMMRILQIPQSQINQFYIDELGMTAEEAKRHDLGELANRWAKYQIAKGAPMTSWLYDDEHYNKLVNKYEKKFADLVDERMANMSDEDKEQLFDETDDITVKSKMAKEVFKEYGYDRDMDGGKPSKRDSEATAKKKIAYQRMRTIEDVHEDAAVRAYFRDNEVSADARKDKSGLDKTKAMLGDEDEGNDKEAMELYRTMRKEIINKYNIEVK